MAAVQLFQRTQRIIDRTGKHEQLYAKTDEHGKVAVLGGNAADDDAQPQAEARHEQEDHRNEEYGIRNAE